MLVGPDSRVLIHEEGLFVFHCTMHQPEMSGQIVVLPGRSA
jgi:plastocyanin